MHLLHSPLDIVTATENRLKTDKIAGKPSLGAQSFGTFLTLSPIYHSEEKKKTQTQAKKDVIGVVHVSMYTNKYTLGRTKRKNTFEHAQNVRIHHTAHGLIRAFALHTFYSI